MNTYRYIYVRIYTYIHMIYEPDIEVPLLLAVSANGLSKRNVCVHMYYMWSRHGCLVMCICHVYAYIYIHMYVGHQMIWLYVMWSLSRVHMWKRFNLCYRGIVVKSVNHQMIWVYVIRVCVHMRAHRCGGSATFVTGATAVVRSVCHQMMWVYVTCVCVRARAQVWRKCDLCYRGNGCRQ